MTQSKKELILINALELFSQNGIDATSTASIAKAAKVATGTLFHHFPNKQTLVHQLYVSIKSDLSQQFSPPQSQQTSSLIEMTRQLWHRAIQWAITYPDKVRFFQLVENSPILSSEQKTEAMVQQLGIIFTLVEQGQQAGIFADYPQTLVAHHCQAQFISASNFFIENPHLIDDKAYCDASFNMFWNALCPLQH